MQDTCKTHLSGCDERRWTDMQLWGVCGWPFYLQHQGQAGAAVEHLKASMMAQ